MKLARPVLAAGCSLLTLLCAHAADKKPNIVHIVADDLGWKDVGFNGCTDIKTPNINKSGLLCQNQHNESD